MGGACAKLRGGPSDTEEEAAPHNPDVAENPNVAEEGAVRNVLPNLPPGSDSADVWELIAAKLDGRSIMCMMAVHPHFRDMMRPKVWKEVTLRELGLIADTPLDAFNWLYIYRALLGNHRQPHRHGRVLKAILINGNSALLSAFPEDYIKTSWVNTSIEMLNSSKNKMAENILPGIWVVELEVRQTPTILPISRSKVVIQATPIQSFDTPDPGWKILNYQFLAKSEYPKRSYWSLSIFDGEAIQNHGCSGMFVHLNDLVNQPAVLNFEKTDDAILINSPLPISMGSRGALVKYEAKRNAQNEVVGVRIKLATKFL